MGRRDRDAIKELKYEYCYRLDALDVDGFVALFTDDARFDIAGIMTGEGQGDLRAFMTTIRDRDLAFLAHMVMNPVIDVDGTTASGRWYYVVMYEADDGSVEWGQGRYDEMYRQVAGSWKIAEVEAERRHTMAMR